MFILENPLKCFIFSLILLALFMIYFKILSYLDSKKKAKNNKSDSKKEDKTENNIQNSKEDGLNLPEVPFSGENYLYDRFVLSPTDEDKVGVNQNANSVFLTEEEYCSIKNRKVEIKVKELENEELSSRLDSVINKDTDEKDKLIREFNSLSKQMKLLLIENILNKN